MTGLEWLAFLVLLIVGLAAGAAATVSNGAVTAAIARLERTYRRQKGLELEQVQAAEVARLEAQARAALAQPDGWRRVLDQALADALPGAGARVGAAGVLDLSACPAPRFTVAGVDGRSYLFTTAPDALRAVGLLRRKEEAVPLDATLSPALRVEVQAVWESLAAGRLAEGQTPTLPRQAEWFLIARQEARNR